jgi:hypothetical protein
MKIYSFSGTFLPFLFAYGGKAASIRGTSMSLESSAFAGVPLGPGNETLAQTQSRRLNQAFVPLLCNANLLLQPCTSFVATYGFNNTYSARVIIPCGKCFNMDHPGPTVTFQNGVDIRGKLTLSSRSKNPLTIKTPMVVVQGELLVSCTEPVDGLPSVTFLLTGGDVDQSFQPTNSNAGACGGSLCKAGTRSITVAGGRVICTFLFVSDSIVALPKNNHQASHIQISCS